MYSSPYGILPWCIKCCLVSLAAGDRCLCFGCGLPRLCKRAFCLLLTFDREACQCCLAQAFSRWLVSFLVSSCEHELPECQWVAPHAQSSGVFSWISGVLRMCTNAPQLFLGCPESQSCVGSFIQVAFWGAFHPIHGISNFLQEFL